MSKRDRGAHARRKADLYNTRDPRAVAPLLPFLSPATRFIEPCVGNGALLEQLEAAGHRCVFASDLARYTLPSGAKPWYADATRAMYGPELERADCFITNPPWTRSILHAIIPNLAAQAPTWLLFDANWIFTKQSAEFMPICSHIVAVGRLRWMLGEPEDKGTDPKDDCIWARFDARHVDGPRFFGRGL